jgi:hypothetical protein
MSSQSQRPDDRIFHQNNKNLHFYSQPFFSANDCGCTKGKFIKMLRKGGGICVGVIRTTEAPKLCGSFLSEFRQNQIDRDGKLS